MNKSLPSIGVCACLVGCSASGRPVSTIPQLSATTDHVIPTRYSADRFFATAVLPRGDTAVLFLDTGSGTFVWDSYIPYLELAIKDSVPNARGMKVGLTPFPNFRADATLPTAIAQTPQGTGLLVFPIDWRAQNNFGAWIGRVTQGQLGNNWFNGRVWTFDYPNHRLTLHDRSPTSDGRGREQPFHFSTDSSGRRVEQVGYVDVIIDGDSVAMLMDTGATVWLSSAALASVNDGGPSERSSSHIPNWLFTRLRVRHPDWPVIEKADLWWGLSLIRVDRVWVGGYEVGPTWFSVLPGPTTPPNRTATAPSWTRRQGGTVGGSLLKNFVMTLDYPRGTVRFYKP